jgi:hypothetical protein
MKKITLIFAFVMVTFTGAFGYSYNIRADWNVYGNVLYDQVSFPYGGYTGEILTYTTSSNTALLEAHAKYYYWGGGSFELVNQGLQYFNYGHYSQFEVWIEGYDNAGPEDGAIAEIQYH